MEINIRKILAWCRAIDHVILRSGDLDNISVGSDIDILTNNVGAICNLLLSGLKEYAQKGFSIRQGMDEGHTHIDILKEGVLIVRFDIVDFLQLNSSIAVNYILSSRVEKEGLAFPSKESEVFTRMLEYSLNPQKTKHIDYARNHCI